MSVASLTPVQPSAYDPLAPHTHRVTFAYAIRGQDRQPLMSQDESIFIFVEKTLPIYYTNMGRTLYYPSRTGDNLKSEAFPDTQTDVKYRFGWGEGRPRIELQNVTNTPLGTAYILDFDQWYAFDDQGVAYEDSLNRTVRKLPNGNNVIPRTAFKITNIEPGTSMDHYLLHVPATGRLTTYTRLEYNTDGRTELITDIFDTTNVARTGSFTCDFEKNVVFHNARLHFRTDSSPEMLPHPIPTKSRIGNYVFYKLPYEQDERRYTFPEFVCVTPPYTGHTVLLARGDATFITRDTLQQRVDTIPQFESAVMQKEHAILGRYMNDEYRVTAGWKPNIPTDESPLHYKVICRRVGAGAMVVDTTDGCVLQCEDVLDFYNDDGMKISYKFEIRELDFRIAHAALSQ